jgi:hypothetical protein
VSDLISVTLPSLTGQHNGSEPLGTGQLELRHRGTDNQLARIASAILRHGGTHAPHPVQLGPYSLLRT